MAKDVPARKRLTRPAPETAPAGAPPPPEPAHVGPALLGPAPGAPQAERLAASPHPHLDQVRAATAERNAPADYLAQFCGDVVAVMGEGFSLTAFAGAINASRKDVEAWIADHPDFAAAVERGRAARTRALEAEFLTAGTGAKVAAHVFALKNAAPQDWREHPDAETAKREAATIVFVSNDRGDELAKRAGRDVG